MMYLWPCLVVVVTCTSLRGAVSCGGRDVQEIAAVLEEVEGWEALAGWLDIRIATINNINHNCQSSERAQCQWRKLVETYCHGSAAGDPHKTAVDIADILDSKIGKKKQAQKLKQLEFTRDSPNKDHEGHCSAENPSNKDHEGYCSAENPSNKDHEGYCSAENPANKDHEGYCSAENPANGNLFDKSEVISRYAEYLRAVYYNSPVANSDKSFPPTLSRKFIKLALVKKQKESRAQAENFTRLTLQGDIDEILKVKEQIAMDDILKADDKVRLVVVEGAPGIGKSTLAWELCRQWPTLESLKRFSLVVLLRLREERVQSATDISDLFPCGDEPGLSSLVAQEVRAVNGEGVLFVFDGFDELPSELREKSLVMDIISGSKYLPKATVLVTSRPSASAQLQELLQTSIGKHIEVVGFSEKEILEFAQSVLHDHDTKLFADFEAYLSANPVVKGMMYNPLNCAIVVGVYKDNYESGKPVPHTQTQLYTELIRGLLRRREKYQSDSKLPDNLEDLKTHDSDLYQCLKEVGKDALYVKLRDQVMLKIIPKGCGDLGLYVKHTALYTRESSATYSFYHVTVQEYMIAFYISQLSDDELETLLKDEPGLLHSTSMDVVWTFVAGLTKINDIRWDLIKMFSQHPTNELTTSLIDGLFNLLSSILCYIRFQSCSQNNVHNIYRALSITMANHTSTETTDHFIPRCFYEAQAKREHCWRVFNEKEIEIYGYRVPNYDLYALGYSISVCNNTWNVSLRGITREGLEMLGHGMKSVDYGGGSIEKLDLHWSEGIMSHSLPMPHKILQRIRTLSLKGGDIDQRGFENLAECIPYLHSLTSLDISDNPGGDGSLVKLLKALRKHGKLRTLHMNSITIGTDDVKALAGLVKSNNLKELAVGGSLLRPLAADVVKQLVRTVLSPSSLKTVTIWSCLYPLDYIEANSTEISSLTFQCFMRLDSLNMPPRGDPSRVKGGTKLSRILRSNRSLKELKLHIPLDKDEVHDIIDSLKDNHSLKRLRLSEEYHSLYFSESDKRAMDSRITLTHH